MRPPDVSHPALLILFGLPGAGKNYVGRILAEDCGFFFHDADDDLPPEMREAIRRGEMVTDAMRDAHLANIAARIAEIRPTQPRLVLSGAFFKERHRRELLARFPDARFVLVDAPTEVREARLARRDHLASLDYARKIAPLFEPPQMAHAVLVNAAGREEVKRQIEETVFGTGGARLRPIVTG